MSSMRPHPALLPLAWVYGGMMAVRNRCYDAGIFTSSKVAAPVISVGNLTAGGTGKTPLVDEIVGRLEAAGRKVGIISRGYGRESKGPVVVARGDGNVVGANQAGDEAAMLAGRHRNAVVIVAERRKVAAEIAVGELGADVLVMDDGYQHRSLRRDLDILVVDGRRDLLHEAMLPAGYRREPLGGIRRAGLLAVSKLDTVEEVSTVARALREWSSAPVFGFRAAFESALDLRTGKTFDLQAGEQAYVMSGIGDPEGFRATVREAGCRVVGGTAFGDHHRYTAADLESVVGRAHAMGAGLIATTEKDAMRLTGDWAREFVAQSIVPHVVFRMKIEIFEGEQELQRAIMRVLKGTGPLC